ncbi:MAG: NAD(P)H-dependent oxidoreductase [Ferruginibacter sp.]
MKHTIIAFSGSLRKESYTTKLIKAFQKSVPDGITVDIIDIGNLPLINEDLENDLPKTVKDLHEKIKGADAILFATPEYNRSYSPVLKNAIDWGSRPEGKNMWDAKPAAVIGCSPYSLGGFGAVNHLRQVMLYVNLYTIQQPEFYVAEIANKMDAEGNINDSKTQKFIDDFWTAFEQWITKLIQ